MNIKYEPPRVPNFVVVKQANGSTVTFPLTVLTDAEMENMVEEYRRLLFANRARQAKADPLKSLDHSFWAEPAEPETEFRYPAGCLDTEKD